MKTLIRLGGCPGWAESLLGAQTISFSYFTMRLIRPFVLASSSAFDIYHLSFVTRKPAFGVFGQVKFKLVCSAKISSQRLGISDIEIRCVVLSRQRLTKTMIRLHGFAGWSASLFFSYVFMTWHVWYLTNAPDFQPVKRPIELVE